MTLTRDIQDHQERCEPHLATLRMLARAEAGTALPPHVVTDVIRATGAILAEADAAGRQARSAARSGPGPAMLLQVRLNRLSAAANDAIAAARSGNATEMRHHVRRLEELTSAIWTVQQAVYELPVRHEARTA